jgi:hypothetical protein
MLLRQGAERTRNAQHAIRTLSIRVAAESIVTLRLRHAVATEQNQNNEEATTAYSTATETTLSPLGPHKEGKIHSVVGTGNEHPRRHDSGPPAGRPG